MNLILSFLNGLGVTLIMQGIHHQLGWQASTIGVLEAWIVSFIAVSIIPTGKWGQDWALHSATKPFMKNLLANIPNCILASIVLSYFFQILATGFSKITLIAGLASIPVAFVVSLIISMIFSPVVAKKINQ